MVFYGNIFYLFMNENDAIIRRFCKEMFIFNSMNNEKDAIIWITMPKPELSVKWFVLNLLVKETKFRNQPWWTSVKTDSEIIYIYIKYDSWKLKMEVLNVQLTEQYIN